MIQKIEEIQVEQPIILAIDTTANHTSIALSSGGVLYSSAYDEEGRGEHSARLAPLVEGLLGELRASGLRLSAVALSAGPGSYTGLRIASSLAKGLCQGFDIPLIALSTLEVMAHAYEQKVLDRGDLIEGNARICPMIDARRMEVYTATFDANLSRLSPDVARILSADEPLESDMQGYTYHLVGSGAEKCRTLWQETSILIDTSLPPLALAMGSLAHRAYIEDQFVDLAYWTPNYLKEYVAVVGKNKVLNR